MFQPRMAFNQQRLFLSICFIILTQISLNIEVELEKKFVCSSLTLKVSRNILVFFYLQKEILRLRRLIRVMSCNVSCVIRMIS